MASLRRRSARNRVIILLHRVGLPAGPTQLLTVAGRTTGKLQNPRGSRAFLRNGLVRSVAPDNFAAAVRTRLP
jgi:hypothetical protein